MASKVAWRPPTIIVSLPCSSVMTLPDMGESTVIGALGAHLLRQRAAGGGCDGARVDDGLARRQPGEQAVRTLEHGLDGRPESVTILNVMSAAVTTARGVSPHSSPCRAATAPWTSAVVAGDGVPLGHGALGHPAAHHAQTYVSQCRHVLVSGRLRSA